jgi:hypothetical protein
MSDQNDAFNEAVKLLRRGNKSSIEIIYHLDGLLGKDKPSWQILSEAETYLKELQDAAFQASVDAFKRGEAQLVVQRKLHELGFSPWNSGVIAERAKAKADAELAEEAQQAQNAAND